MMDGPAGFSEAGPIHRPPTTTDITSLPLTKITTRSPHPHLYTHTYKGQEARQEAWEEDLIVPVFCKEDKERDSSPPSNRILSYHHIASYTYTHTHIGPKHKLLALSTVVKQGGDRRRWAKPQEPAVGEEEEEEGVVGDGGLVVVVEEEGEEDGTMVMLAEEEEEEAAALGRYVCVHVCMCVYI